MGEVGVSVAEKSSCDIYVGPAAQHDQDRFGGERGEGLSAALVLGPHRNPPRVSLAR